VLAAFDAFGQYGRAGPFRLSVDRTENLGYGGGRPILDYAQIKLYHVGPDKREQRQGITVSAYVV
jgi:hypothetical protein